MLPSPFMLLFVLFVCLFCKENVGMLLVYLEAKKGRLAVIGSEFALFSRVNRAASEMSGDITVTTQTDSSSHWMPGAAML